MSQGLETGTHPHSHIKKGEHRSPIKNEKAPTFTVFHAAIAVEYLDAKEKPLIEKLSLDFSFDEAIEEAEAIIDRYETTHSGSDMKGVAIQARVNAFSALHTFAEDPSAIITWGDEREKKIDKTEEDKKEEQLVFKAIKLGLALHTSEKGHKVTPLDTIVGKINASATINQRINDGNGNRTNH